MTYHEVLDYLYAQLPMFQRVGPAAYKPGLDNTYKLLEIIGNPHIGLHCVHIAGTNGKGSTSHLIASVLQEAGYKTGLCTSPHLKDFRERIKINGALIPKEDVAAFVNEYKSAWDVIQPSFFEMTIALSFWYFKQKKTDIAVIETGLGGRLDSTNVILPEVAVITNIGMDHMNLLGDTIELIAAEKAGIIKKNTPVVIGPMRGEAAMVMKQKASALQSAIIDASGLLPENVPETSLRGHYQNENRRTAYAALQLLQHGGWKIEETHIRDGFMRVIENTSLLGRWQQLGENPLIIADVAHNEDGIRSVIQQLNNMQFNRLHVVLGMVSDKDISRVLALLPQNAIYYFCKANIPRGMDASMLAEQASEFGLHGEIYASVNAAFTHAQKNASPDDLIFVGGSVFTVAEVL
jgi:dihydrofolate synthase/folylpolyglutamate synthase